ncbi:toxin-antitoxin system TumE family protein [Leptospirillum ferrooxidans]
MVGYDNEKGKGDHRHYRDREEPYVFRTVDRLIEDFNTDVKREEQQ